MVIGFIGSGNMAAAMARGWSGGGPAAPSKMLFTDSGSGRARLLAEEVGGAAKAGNRELVEESDAVILAVSPPQLDAVAAEIGSPDLLLSLLGAVSLNRLVATFPDSDVLRLMPNLAVEVRKGVICVAEGGAEPGKGRDSVFSALEVIGEVVELDDALIDPATAMMGCSPAFFAEAAQALADVGASHGLDPEAAVRMVGLSMAGTAELLTRRTPFEISTEVAHPGGSTEAGLAALEEEGGVSGFRAAGEAALRRMEER